MFILRVKKAMKDAGLYAGKIDENWEALEERCWEAYCNRYGGYFSPIPSYSNQTLEFKQLLDSLDVTEYTIESIPTSSGVDVRQFIPERVAFNTEGMTKEHIRAVDGMLNENVVKPAETFIADNKKATLTPEEVLQLEKRYNKQINKTSQTIVPATQISNIRTR